VRRAAAARGNLAEAGSGRVGVERGVGARMEWRRSVDRACRDFNGCARGGRRFRFPLSGRLEMICKTVAATHGSRYSPDPTHPAFECVARTLQGRPPAPGRRTPQREPERRRGSANRVSLLRAAKPFHAAPAGAARPRNIIVAAIRQFTIAIFQKPLSRLFFFPANGAGRAAFDLFRARSEYAIRAVGLLTRTAR